ncbi:MAG: radical SAM protein [Patescibacteria group bacterium]|jgi:uncharacterized Fe-S cluster-containing radical SAM superfamily protein
MSDSGKKMPKPPYENRIEGWWFKDEEIRSANKVGKMLTLDLDIGKACDLHCSFCFASTHSKDNKDYINKNTIRIKQILKEAAELGCKSIKIVGAGEPLLFPNLIEILEYCKKLKIIPIIFTGGHVFGDDNRAKNVFKKYGINSAKELVDKLYRLDCCFIVKFMSLNPKLHAKLVGANFDYIKYRDQGLLNLIERGFNYTKPTRLGVDCLLLKDNYREAVSLFSFFNQFNIFCVLNTSMDCGKTEYKLANPQVISKDKALKVSIDLYRYCLKNKIPFDKRISPYFCSPVCSQLNHGLFIGDDNIVKACPGGPDIAQYSKGKLKEIWKNNPFRKKYNEILGHECISRVGRTYHEDFEYRVRKAIKFIK